MQLTIDRKAYLMHRIIWKLVTGEDPPEQIDHIDHNPFNNQWSNLRLASQSQNIANRSRWGAYPKGVHKNGDGFIARLMVEGKQHNLGTYPTVEEAADAYKRACTAIHEKFACVG